jgi:hypothetical protein
MVRCSRQELETLINEEALLLAKFLRNEIKEWNPRIQQFSIFFGFSYEQNTQIL